MQQKCADGILTLSGNIDNHTVTRAVYRDFTQHMTSGVRHIVFADIGRTDSACVSLLISAKRILKDTPLTISGAPAVLGDLLKLYRLNEWIILS